MLTKILSGNSPAAVDPHQGLWKKKMWILASTTVSIRKQSIARPSAGRPSSNERLSFDGALEKSFERSGAERSGLD